TFVKVWRKVDSYEGARGSLDTWILLIARSLAIDSIRRRVLETRILAAQEDPGEASSEPGPEDRAETSDMVERARRAMGARDQGVALFASAAHLADPPEALKERVLGVLADEWNEAAQPPPRRVPVARWWLAVAAAFVLLAGTLAFAGVAQSNASKWHDDAASY